MSNLSEGPMDAPTVVADLLELANGNDLDDLAYLRKEMAWMVSNQKQMMQELRELRELYAETKVMLEEKTDALLMSLTKQVQDGTVEPRRRTKQGSAAKAPGASDVKVEEDDTGDYLEEEDAEEAEEEEEEEEEEEVLELQLTGNPAVDEKLQELVQPDCSVTSLSFSGSKLGAEGAQAVAAVLKINTTLTELNLSHCGIGGRGGMAIAQSLMQNSTLKRLVLTGNSLGAEGGTNIALCLKYNQGLESLNLQYNGLGEHVGLTLVDSLKANSTLKKLQVMYDGLSEEGGSALADIVSSNTTLQELEVGGSREDLTAEGQSQLLAALKNNHALRKLKFFDDATVFWSRKAQ